MGSRLSLLCLLCCAFLSHLSGSYYPFPTGNEIARLEAPFAEPQYRPLKNSSSSSSFVQQRASALEERLNQKIFGQQEAVRATANAFLRYAAGLNDPSKPIATLFYCGPSGVGKTELAKQLSLALYEHHSPLIRINLSEFIEATSISRLIGASPGYVGYQEGGLLANALLQQPASVVLLDEIEKAHPKVLKLFMHVFDEGYFTSSKGEKIDCTKCVFLLTSNLAADKIAFLCEQKLDPETILKQIEPIWMAHLSAELYNRLDPVVFVPLSRRAHKQLTKKILDELSYRVYSAQNIFLVFDDSVVTKLMQVPLDPQLGARPLKRLVKCELATLLAKAIVENRCAPDDVLLCSYKSGLLSVDVVTELVIRQCRQS